MLESLTIPVAGTAIRRALAPRRFSRQQRRSAALRVAPPRRSSHPAASVPAAVRARATVLPPLSGDVPAIDVVAVADPEALPVS